ncbi:hypothetical protein CHS0354_021520 [Potamilus streckersoni]|uniref:Small VCP/p97-interacting protein n=1 Tax=Potamilus streckersoni TaxID=2493646 RepID=A0AAE0SNJ2_9BIVA|nr:hypothetical protein CHS0354_021520 [Potamilus streckersoni]
MFNMGMICSTCLEEKSEDSPTPETRRRQQAEAAEKRRKENESRGIKDAEAFKMKQKRREEIERKAEQAAGREEGNLRWQVG